jgi:hypothetical protein
MLAVQLQRVGVQLLALLCLMVDLEVLVETHLEKVMTLEIMVVLAVLVKCLFIIKELL